MVRGCSAKGQPERHEPGTSGTAASSVDEDLDELIAAQEKFLNVVGFQGGSVQ